jgi:hypothetical protein
MIVKNYVHKECLAKIATYPHAAVLSGNGQIGIGLCNKDLSMGGQVFMDMQTAIEFLQKFAARLRTMSEEN